MKNNNYTYHEILDRLRINDSQTAKELVMQIIEIALQKIGLVVGDLITEDKLGTLSGMFESSGSTDDILDFIELEIPEYQRLLKATIDDLVDEMADNQKRVENSSLD